MVGLMRVCGAGDGILSNVPDASHAWMLDEILCICRRILWAG